MLNLNNHGYCVTPFTFLLWPFSYFFRLIVFIRRCLYRFHFKKTIHFSVPVIVVGNITVGGTGKTPLVIYLAQFLKTQGYLPGIVSRGVGGKQEKEPVWVDAEADPLMVGDEALLLAIHSDCPVVICRDRVLAAQSLLSSTHCNIILSDDGLQHYRLGRDIEIVVIDGARQFGNGFLLPAGPLREPISRLKKVDMIVQNGGLPVLDRYAMTLQLKHCVAVRDTRNRIPLDQFRGQSVHAVAAIGNPSRFFESLRDKGLMIIEHAFPDHYAYMPADLNFLDDLPILMTEKDAVKCTSFADDRYWCVPVETIVDERMQDALMDKLKRTKKH